MNLGGYASDASPFVALGYVFFQGTDNTLWRINLDGSFGIKLGNYKTQSSPFVAGTYVYFRGTDDKLWRIHQDGSGGVNLEDIKRVPRHMLPCSTSIFRVRITNFGRSTWMAAVASTWVAISANRRLRWTPRSISSISRVRITLSGGLTWTAATGSIWEALNCSSTPFAVQPANQPQTGTSRLSYILLTVVYAPPGTNGGKSWVPIR